MSGSMLKAVSILALLVASSCAATDTKQASAPKRLANVETAPLQGPIASELEALGLEPTTDEARLMALSDDLGIAQIEQASDVREDYAFDEVEGNHPCLTNPDLSEDCKAISEDILNRAQRAAKVRKRNAAVDLQAITPDVVDPDTFDPTRTAEEIGRVRELRSDAAQAVGAFLLGESVLVPVTPEPDLPDTVSPDQIELPELASDFIANQTAPGSSTGN